MTSADNISVRSLKRQLMKLSKAQLIKECKEYNVSHIGSKNEMTARIVFATKIEKKKKKKLNKHQKKKKRKNKKRKSILTNIENTIDTKKQNTEKQCQTSHKQLSKLFQTSHSTNLYTHLVESADIFEKNVIYSSITMRGYKEIKKISPTLQGKVFIARETLLHKNCTLIYGFVRQIICNYNKHKKMNDNHKEIIQICYMYYKKDIVIKSANKCYYTSNITTTEKEDIIKEAHLMSIFQRTKNVSKFMIKYIDFFQDKNNYYLVMEKGGKGLFEFNVNAHQLIDSGVLDLCEWRNTVKCIFYKMVEFVYWLHNKLHCSHLDISLENIIMSNNTHFDVGDGKFANINIRFIDFGLAELFDLKNNSDFMCSKYVGKLGYQAPQVYDKKPFQANKADIYSLGICLFLMSIGAPPYTRPSDSDQRFQIIKDGKIKELLKCWNRLHYIEDEQLQLLMGMICIDENERLSLEQIINHVWLKEYHNKRSKHKRSMTPSIVESNTLKSDIIIDCFAAVDDIKK